MAVQKDHDLADDLLLRPGCGNALGADRADAIDLTQPIRLGFDDVEHLLPECLDHLPGVARANTADHAGGEILLDALDGTGRRGAHEPRLELLAMGAVVDPITRGRDPFSGGDRGGVADNGGEIAVPSRLHTQHAETGLGAVECHPLDDAGEHLAVGLRGGRRHGHGQDYSPSLGVWRAASQMAMARLLPARGLCVRKGVSG